MLLFKDYVGNSHVDAYRVKIDDEAAMLMIGTIVHYFVNHKYYNSQPTYPSALVAIIVGNLDAKQRTDGYEVSKAAN